MAAAPGSKPSTPPECGFTKQELFERLEKARTAAPDLFADFFFKTKEEAPERFKHLADGVLVRCLECGRTMGAHPSTPVVPAPVTAASAAASDGWLTSCFPSGVFVMAGCDAGNPHAAVVWFVFCLLAVIGFHFCRFSLGGVADNGVWQLVTWGLAWISVRIVRNFSQSKI